MKPFRGHLACEIFRSNVTGGGRPRYLKAGGEECVTVAVSGLMERVSTALLFYGMNIYIGVWSGRVRLTP